MFEQQQQQAAQEAQTDSEQDAVAQASEAGDAEESGAEEEECTPCDGGDGCHAGCRMMTPRQLAELRHHRIQKDINTGKKLSQDQKLSLFKPKGYNVVPLGADGVMPKGEEFGSNVGHCKSGNCEPLENNGLKVHPPPLHPTPSATLTSFSLCPLPHFECDCVRCVCVCE